VFLAQVGVAATLPGSAAAPQASRAYRLGLLSFVPKTTPATMALFDGLRSMGFIEGSNLTVDDRGVDLRREQLPSIARQLAQTGIDALGDGALLGYGPSQLDTFRQMGRMVAKVLRGARPAELPVEQPTTFKLAVHLKLAREFGIALPSAILERTDQVIE
jgi:hypothetical protein